ncbi:head maturation protease, ClpP-related [Methylocella sp.]|uniref:head maturation protease, ClpP-related n=1 Tax=Methylocella sp. TaxID=1978226 RepID=UPI0037839E0C
MTRTIYDLLARNRAPKRSGPHVVAGSDGSATIYLYDVIGCGAIEADALVKELDALDARRIDLRINSPGGDVFAARAIKTALERHPAKVTAYVDGLAASAASVVMLGAERVLIAPGAFVMLHQPWTVAAGDARTMRARQASRRRRSPP